VVALVSGLTNAVVRRLRWYKALSTAETTARPRALAATVFHAAGAELTAATWPPLIVLAGATGWPTTRTRC